MHQILALWCHPRSLSTAFGRMMMERGDISVLHERFLYLYYVVQNPDLVIAQQLERVEPWMQASFDEVVEGIESEASRRPVFFKDMAVHVHNPKGRYADEAFLGRYSNAFLIRDPAIAVPSHLKQNPEMIFEEVGYDAQFALFEVVSQMTGAAPPVIDAADLEEDPEMIVQAYCDAMRIPFVSSALRWGSSWVRGRPRPHRRPPGTPTRSKCWKPTWTTCLRRCCRRCWSGSWRPAHWTPS